MRSGEGQGSEHAFWLVASRVGWQTGGVEHQIRLLPNTGSDSRLNSRDARDISGGEVRARYAAFNARRIDI